MRLSINLWILYVRLIMLKLCTTLRSFVNPTYLQNFHANDPTFNRLERLHCTTYKQFSHFNVCFKYLPKTHSVIHKINIILNRPLTNLKF